MKTVHELIEEEERLTKKYRKAARLVSELFLGEVLSVGVHPYTDNHTSAEQSIQVREKLHARIAQALDPLDPQGVQALGVGCDRCRTELYDPRPGIILTTHPPRRNAACVGCGWAGSIPVSLVGLG